MPTDPCPTDAFGPLIRRLDSALRIEDVPALTLKIKEDLEQFVCNGEYSVPERFRRSGGESYARRLVHSDPDRGYSVVAMTWGPGQGTELHDHAGVWCVECVLDGELEVTQYDLLERQDRLYRFEKRRTMHAGVGEAGCLIPPYEYHTLGNALADGTTVTLHVYGGEMGSCNLYRPRDAGWWERVPKVLTYDA